METGRFLFDGPERARWLLILAHGAGQGMASCFMADMAAGIAAAGGSAGGVRVARFEFPYMIRARAAGRPRPPDREPVLLQAWREAVTALRRDRSQPVRLAVGGKSLGGRMASLIADEVEAEALLCFGYPFHPPGRPDRLRTGHLMTLAAPTLICQGERDSFGSRSQVPDYGLPERIRLHWLADGDHSFKPRRASGLTGSQNRQEACRAAVAFLASLD